MKRRRPYHRVKGRMQRRMFLWFGATVAITALVVVIVGQLVGSPRGWRRDAEGARAFVGEVFSRAWDQPEDRRALASSLSREMALDLVLRDESGREIERWGACSHQWLTVSVHSSSGGRGSIELCPQHGHTGSRGWIVLMVAVATVWGASGFIARRLSRPLLQLAEVARDLGRGRADMRARLERHRYDEVGVVATALYEADERIERQLADQRALLAAVSHEIRTPLARMRLLAELARGGDAKPLADMDAEIVGMDALVADLLASSRVDFGALTRKRVTVASLAREALSRAEVDVAVLRSPEHLSLEVDPTLIVRALVNLLHNARLHADGVETLLVEESGSVIRFSVLDRGPGLAAGEENRIFEPFYRASSAATKDSVGLGLALVRRIATAHGGSVFARNREPHGSVIGFEIPTAPSV